MTEFDPNATPYCDSRNFTRDIKDWEKIAKEQERRARIAEQELKLTEKILEITEQQLDTLKRIVGVQEERVQATSDFLNSYGLVGK